MTHDVFSKYTVNCSYDNRLAIEKREGASVHMTVYLHNDVAK